MSETDSLVFLKKKILLCGDLLAVSQKPSINVYVLKQKLKNYLTDLPITPHLGLCIAQQKPNASNQGGRMCRINQSLLACDFKRYTCTVKQTYSKDIINPG